MKRKKTAAVAAMTLAAVIWIGCQAQGPNMAPATAPAAMRRHVVVVVMDGLRPDTVTAEDMPTAFGMSKQGTFFAHHHPVYVSSTEVNGTAIATGSYPEHSGIISNTEYRPLIEASAPIATESQAVIRKGDEVMDGHYLAVETMAEALQRGGLRTAVAGTKGVAILQDRKEREAGATSVTVFAGHSLPAVALAVIEKNQGAFPAVVDSTREANVPQDSWTARALTEVLWKDEVPALSVMWLSEPDYAQHATGPGSPVSKQALRSSDDRLATVIAALKAKNVYDSTDILLVSDHGFSTIERPLDTVVSFRRAGFKAARTFSATPADGDVLVDGNGGSVSLYVAGHDQPTVAGLVKYLQTSDFAGVIFTRDGLAGTFKLEEGKLHSPAAPDILFSMRWKDEVSKRGLPGLVISDGLSRGAGQGMHVTLSKYDMHNTLIAIGPDIKKAFVDELPSGNIDVAPTVLAILGVTPLQPMDGRVLTEALTSGGGAAPGKPETKRIEATATIDGTKWTQYLQRTQLDGRIYIDEGNGAPVENK